MSIFSRQSRSYKRGFTLIELLVVMALMVVITGALLVQQSRFDSSTLLRSLAYSVALSVRQAQVYGTSVFGTTTSSGAVYASGYGVYFTASTPGQYVLFADLNNNGTYNAGEDVKVFSLNNGYVVSDICATQGATNYCWVANSGLLGSSASLSIIYKRPNPEACITTNTATAACASGATPVYSSAYVQIRNASDPTNTRKVTVNSTGEIAVCSVVGC